MAMSDPRSTAIAARLLADAMGDVSKRLQSGDNLHGAREAVLGDLAPAWAQIAGKDAADQATRGMLFLSAREILTPGERRGLAMFQRMEIGQHQREQIAWQSKHDEILARVAPHLLPKPRKPFPWRVAAMALLALLVAAGGLLAFVRPSAALDAGQERWRALAACGRATLGTAEYERRCRRFSRTERSVTRDYDFEGAGAPRDWERKKIYD